MKKSHGNSDQSLSRLVRSSTSHLAGFRASFLGFFLAGIILELYDRHPENVLIHTDTPHIFHIDFGKSFGEQNILEFTLGYFMFIPTSVFSSEILDALRDFEEESDEDVMKKIKRDVRSCYNTLRTCDEFYEAATALGVRSRVLNFKEEEIEQFLEYTFTGYFNSTRGLLHDFANSQLNFFKR